MPLHRAILVLLLISLTPAEAQRRRIRIEPIPSWGIDGGTRYAVLADDEVSFASARFGRQLDTSLNIGVGASYLLTASAETRTADGFDRYTSLILAGPSLELRDSLRGPVGALLRIGLVGGLLGFEQERGGIRSDGNVIVGGIDPGVGIQVRATRRLQASATFGALCLWRIDDGRAIVAGPIASMAIRVVF